MILDYSLGGSDRVLPLRDVIPSPLA